MKIFGIMKFPPIYGNEGLELHDRIMRLLIELSARYGIKKYSRYYTMLPDPETSPTASVELSKKKIEFEILGVEHIELMKRAHIAADRVFHEILVQLEKPLAKIEIDGHAITISSVDDQNFEKTIDEMNEIKRLWEKGTSKETAITFRAEIISEEGFEKTAQRCLNVARKRRFHRSEVYTENPKIRLKSGFKSKGRYEKALEIISKKKLMEYESEQERISELVVRNDESSCVLSAGQNFENYLITMESRDVKALESMVNIWRNSGKVSCQK